MLKKLSLTAILSVVLATGADANKVRIATDGTGDFLIAPLYIAQDDICSVVKVFNTNETNSILAKVVFREHVSSHEVDFPIFLSPGDVWEGKVCQQKNGSVVLTSTDDSNHPSALETLKIGQNLGEYSSTAINRHTDIPKGYVEIDGRSYAIKESQKDNIDFKKGYIEIFPIAQFNEGSKIKVRKSTLVERWDNLERGNLSLLGIRTKGVDNNSLSGLVSFQTANQETSTVPMMAFENTHDHQYAGSTISYNSEASAEKLLGKHKKIAILKLTQKANLSFTYDKAGVDQYLNITFPFSHKEKQSRRFKLTIRDNSENKYTMIFSPLPNMSDELTVFSVEELVKLTRNIVKFNEGMIQIKEIINNDAVQLGKNKVASIIATKSRIATIGGATMVIDTSFVPVK